MNSKNYFKKFVENVISQKNWTSLTLKKVILDGRIFAEGDDRRANVGIDDVWNIEGEILAIDDIAPLILNHGLQKTSKFILQKFKKIIARCSTDLISKNELLSVLSLANLTANILENFDEKLWKFTTTKQFSYSDTLVTRVRLCTGQGRVVSSILGVDSNGESIQVTSIEKKTHVERILKDKGEEEQERTLKKSAVPISTFNMGVKSHEKDAREAIVLPFHNDSKIEYIPDENDYFDDS